ncbi:MAG: polysaccharide biosynthesis protein [Phycisphaeraceae bacterium]|nr:polysaccharide biosynthesis protein [Phycisphaeraceae bacterium]
MGTASVRTPTPVSIPADALRIRLDPAVDQDPLIQAAFPPKPVLVLVGHDRSNPTHTPVPSSQVRSVLLVGTDRTLRGLEAQVAGRPGVSVAGHIACDAVSGSTRPAASHTDGRWSLGSIDAALDTLRPDAAIVALPSGSAALAEAVDRALEARAIPHRRVPAIDDILDDLQRSDRADSPNARVTGPNHTHATTRSSRPRAWRTATTAAPAPAHNQPLSTHAGVLVPRVIDYATLIGRVPYEPDRAAVARILTGKRVLITGAGGSIGSELARVACAFAPAEIVLMERAENALFEIDRQVRSRWPGIPRRAVLHDVVDADRTTKLLADMRPHVVFHAAAHKHVPLMEDHPAHAVVNNLLGTKAIADAAAACGAERFVMISSDKAVNPTSVMGATKRMAELYVRWLGTRPDTSATRMSMVRFGNVLGSAASVLTIWGTQLAEGSPLTVTDPRMTRYFMTIPEAATLVIQSAALEAASTPAADRAVSAAGMYVLDMGEPIRILDLAGRFARAHGLGVRLDTHSAVRSAKVPGRRQIERELERWLADHAPPPNEPTVDLVFTGIRPGEKLHEELAYAAELLRPTDHPGVQAWAGEEPLGDVPAMVAEMTDLCLNGSPTRVVEAIRKHVPEMKPAPM